MPVGGASVSDIHAIASRLRLPRGHESHLKSTGKHKAHVPETKNTKQKQKQMSHSNEMCRKADTANRMASGRPLRAFLLFGCVPISSVTNVVLFCSLVAFPSDSVRRQSLAPPPSSGRGHTARSKGGGATEKPKRRSVSLLHLLRFSPRLRLGRPNDIRTLNEGESVQTGWGRFEPDGGVGVGLVEGREGSKERGLIYFQSAVGKEERPVQTELFSSRQRERVG